MDGRNQVYHTPVMLEECLEFLQIKADGIYVDATYGGGGHSRAILNNLGAKGCLIGFDQDKEALANIIDDVRLELVWANYKYLGHFLDYFNFGKVDGVLADLGVSSHQFDEGSRGFSYRFDANLDMRMNESISITAKDILNSYDVERLQYIFSSYGELRNAKTLANAVIEMRSRSPFDSISSLLMLLERHYFGDRNRYQAQVFQALRIEVNDELGGLTEFLYEAFARLKKGGRLVVMSYHSLEDRLVKNITRELIEKYREGESDFDLKVITRKPVEASAIERKENSRANSAKLRVIEKK